ncbi:MAG: glycosyltransferase family A protein, partial [Actinomycetota bacterium]
GHLPEPVLTAFAAVDPRDLVNDLRRERTSARQRRVVHAHASVRAVVDRLLVDAGRRGVRLPSLSALVASNRPSMIDNWARLLDAQDYPDLEVVACLHGDDFTEADEARARELLGDRISIHRVPADQTLGDALNTAVEHASGDVLVKWDDDDLYDTAHLADLIHAREYSGATLVGKAPEFTYLAGLDVTVRRLKTTAEGFSPTIGGPTLCIGRSDLRDIGGWRRSRRRVDSLLIEDVRAAGGTTYRTAGFGFVLMRAAAGRHSHTWAAGDDYFLSRSVDQRPGLDLEFAGITAPADVVERWSS